MFTLWNFHFLQKEEVNFQEWVMQLEIKEFFMEAKMEVYTRKVYFS